MTWIFFSQNVALVEREDSGSGSEGSSDTSDSDYDDDDDDDNNDTLLPPLGDLREHNIRLSKTGVQKDRPNIEVVGEGNQIINSHIMNCMSESVFVGKKPQGDTEQNGTWDWLYVLMYHNWFIKGRPDEPTVWIHSNEILFIPSIKLSDEFKYIIINHSKLQEIKKCGLL